MLPIWGLVLILNGGFTTSALQRTAHTKGHSFRTAVRHHSSGRPGRGGENCLTRLNGMFAFALWDEKERALFLVRDRVGIKPLYYAHQDRSLAFASEVKSILASGLVKAELDRESLHQFLTFLWAPDPNTLFHGIKTVPPGHFVKLPLTH